MNGKNTECIIQKQRKINILENVLNATIGDINTALDTINGEVVN